MNILPPSPTFGAALDEVQELAELGWRIVSDDRPEACEVAFIASKRYSAGVRQRRIAWRPYGHLLTPTLTLVENEDDFYDLFAKHFPHRVFKCDDPSEDLLGFVCYCKQRERRSTVFRSPLDLARDLGPVFLDARNVAQRENLRILLADA